MKESNKRKANLQLREQAPATAGMAVCDLARKRRSSLICDQLGLQRGRGSPESDLGSRVVIIFLFGSLDTTSISFAGASSILRTRETKETSYGRAGEMTVQDSRNK